MGMEELPDEVAVLVLQHIEPLRDAAAVSGACRRWRRLMLDPHLWSLFHRRVFPACLGDEGVTPEAHEGDLGGATNWRLSFVERAKKLKAALDSTSRHWHARAASSGGHDARLLAAAEAGYLPLAERALAELVAIHGNDYDRVLGLVYDDKSSLIDECLYRACRVGSAPVAQLFLGLADYAHGWDHRNAAVRSGNRQLVGLLFKATTRGEALLRSKSKFTFNEKAEQGWELDVAPAAARKGDSEMLKLLLDHGVKPRCLLTLGNAAKSGNLECVQMLIDRGYCFQNDALYLRHYAYAGGGMVGQAANIDVVGLGVESGNVDIVRLLRNHGHPVVTSHTVIALQQSKSPSMDMLLELVPSLEELDWYACLTSSALQRGDVAVCRFLIEHGVDVNIVDPRKRQTALHHAIEHKCLQLAQCLLECGARTNIRAPGLGVTAVGLARQYATPVARFVVQHSTESKRTGGKRRRPSSAAASHEGTKKTQAGPDGGGGSEDGEADASNKPKAKKQKKEPAAEKLHEKELEAEVRQLAKLGEKAKVDVFSLRQMLRARGVLAGDIPTRKLALLELAVDWLSAGN